MGSQAKKNRIPLPPVLLSVVPFIGMMVGVILALELMPEASAWGLLLGALVGFGLPVIWIARRVRG